MYLGFTAVVVLLAVAIGATLWKVSAIKQGTDRIVNLRTPTTQASARMTNDINASLATLRGVGARHGGPRGTCHNIHTRTCSRNAAYMSYPPTDLAHGGFGRLLLRS